MDSVPDALKPPEGNPRFLHLDAMRALAALAVVFFHADAISQAQNQPLGHLCEHLDVGVAVFFFLTAFLLYRPYVAAARAAAPRVPLRLFWWRRFLRIAPGYWVALAVLSIFPGLYFYRTAVPNIAFAQIYSEKWSRTGIPPAWSICVEVSFYIALPLYAWLIGRAAGSRPSRRRAIELGSLLVLAVSSLGYRSLLTHIGAGRYATDPLPGTFLWFAPGMAAAVISVEPGRFGDRVKQVAAQRGAMCWATALVIYALLLTSGESGVEGRPVMFISYAAIAALLVAPLVFGDRGLPTRIVDRVWLRWLGVISYGIYLYHWPLMSNLHFRLEHHVRLSATEDAIILAGAGAVAAILCGAASYYAIERPVLTLKNPSRLRGHPFVARALGVLPGRS